MSAVDINLLFLRLSRIVFLNIGLQIGDAYVWRYKNIVESNVYR